MDYGVGLDASLRLTWDEEAHVSREAARLGYTSLWTPESGGYDGFHVCAHRWRATNEAYPGGLTTGIAVSPVALRSPLGLAMGAGTVSALTGGRFILGIGTGGLHQRAGREAHGARPVSPLALMRDYLTVLRGLLDGERVTHDGPAVSVRGLRLDVDPPPRTPVYLGALGPQMLRLAGELADGVIWANCCRSQLARSLSAVPAAKRERFIVGDVAPAYVSEDRSEALAAVRLALTNYMTLRNYQNYFIECGYADEVEQARAAIARDDHAAVAAAVSERMADDIGIYGTPADVRKRVAAFQEAGMNQLCLSTMFHSQDQAKAIMRVAAAFD